MFSPRSSSWIQTKFPRQEKNRFLNKNNTLEAVSLSKISSLAIQPRVPPTKEVLSISDTRNLVRDVLGKFNIEKVFCETSPFPGSNKDIFFHQTTKGTIYIFILSILNIYLNKSYLYCAITIPISKHDNTWSVKNIKLYLFFTLLWFIILLFSWS